MIKKFANLWKQGERRGRKGEGEGSERVKEGRG
jgi:hypothetical protein